MQLGCDVGHFASNGLANTGANNNVQPASRVGPDTLLALQR
jgi:hypothetical protein